MKPLRPHLAKLAENDKRLRTENRNKREFEKRESMTISQYAQPADPHYKLRPHK